MIPYLIKTAACSAIFLFAYLLLLEREKMHRFNRWYLVLSVLASFIIPLVSVPVSQPVFPALSETLNFNWQIPVTPATDPSIDAASNAARRTIPGWMLIYCIITGVLLLRMLRNLYLLSRACRSRQAIRYRDARLIVRQQHMSSFSFLNTIFISESDYDAETETKVLTHELAHVAQKHSLDILFIELVITFCWFNPLFLLYKKSIQANHEYLADEAVIARHPDPVSYQYLLLEKASMQNPLPLTSNFNFSDLKKRLVMITRQYNPWRALAKKLTTLPLLTVALISFGSGIAAVKTVANIPPFVQPADTTPGKPFRIIRAPFDLPVSSGTGISKEEFDEYNRIVAANTTKDAWGHETMEKISPADRARLETLYKQMNREQRSSTRVSFGKKIPPPDKLDITAAQMEKWKNPASYGVWIDNEKVDNSKLNDYKPADFSGYNESSLRYTEKMKKDVMERFHLKQMYKVQVDLMTNAYYQKILALSNAQPEHSMYYRFTHTRNGKSVEGYWLVRQ
ncbi:MAG: M56 family metallopeptidase [Chitinophagaceae bacterium]|nr:M56 family metallopeptidase [Chitinophagaceae bacterium]